MATVFESPFIRQRLHRLRQREIDFEEDQRFGRCDCASYSYFVLSMVLFSVGTVITVLALGDADGYILNNLGHMWLVGPIFICSGIMVAVKSMLYLRRKSVLQLLLHQRAIIRDIAAAQAEQAYNNGQVARSASTATLPPAYDALIVTTILPQTSNSEMPPPTYDEAVFLIGEDKLQAIVESKVAADDSKEAPDDSDTTCINLDSSKP